MKLTFWLLDVNYEVKDHMPEVWLWGIDDKENRVLFIIYPPKPDFRLVILNFVVYVKKPKCKLQLDAPSLEIE